MNHPSRSEQKPFHPRPARESGQALVVVALMMLGLLAATGLAVDGGGLFFLQRDAQNATDASVLSASYAICTDGDPVAAGLATMASNGFDNNGVSNKIFINHPPTSGESAGNRAYVEVVLIAYKPAYFIQLVYKRPLEVRTRAIGNCLERFDPSTVPGLWAGSTTCNDTVNWTGSNSTIVGGMFSNNQIKFKGSEVNLSGGEILSVGDIAEDQSDKIHYDPSYPPTEGNAPRNDPVNLDISLYAPGGEVSSVMPADHYHAIPRLETTGWKSNNNLWDPTNGTVLEGLYYIEGDVSVGNGVKVGPEGVTIVATGEIKFSGKTDTPPISYYQHIMDETERGVHYPGIIFYSNQLADRCGSNALSISEPDGRYHGIAYVPRSGINISGSSIYFHGTLVAQTIDYSGSNGTLRYDPSLLPGRAPQIQMVE
jgi:hypothetical protein